MQISMHLACGTMRLSILILFAAQADAAVELLHRAERIEPSLEPKSDKKFMEKDYPIDKRSVTDKHYVFDHPYPAVQDSGDFDKDYVKDENSDGGKWDAQMKYDSLRAKIVKEKAQMEELQKKMKKEYEEYLRAKGDSDDLGKALSEAKKEVGVARGAADSAAKRVNDLEGSSQNDGTKVGGAIGDAVKDVEKEMDDLEKCKKALAEAKKKLKDLVKQKEQAEAAKEKAKEKEKAAKAKKEEQATSAKSKNAKEGEGSAGAKSDGKNAEDKENSADEDAEKSLEDLHKEVEKETKEASDWRKTYLKELEEVRTTEKALEEAARRLKKFRRPPYVDNDGGVYNVPSERSVAVKASSPLVFATMIVAIMFIAFSG